MTHPDKVMRAEWEKQRYVLLAFPHEKSDWNDPGNPSALQKALSSFVRIAQAIAYKQPVIIICDDKTKIASLFCSTHNMIFVEIETNDTWIRDYGPIGIKEGERSVLLDFIFDGWGGKFDATLDNEVNKKLHATGLLAPMPLKSVDLVLEGGSVESDGKGTILTTSMCLLKRNGFRSKKEAEVMLKEHLGAKRVLWLDEGFIAGDDTDGHIDMLVRFADEKTILYQSCDDPEDEHYEALQKMHAQLRTFRDYEGNPYRLIALPMPKPIFNEAGDRLPSSYANFLITNHALLYPTYGDKEVDKEVDTIFKVLFKDKEIIPIDARRLITQGGSLHCSTIQVHA